MTWCQECWLKGQKREPSIGEYDGEELCKRHMDEAREANGDPPLEETKWGTLFVSLAALPIGQVRVLDPKPQKPKEYANRIGSALRMSKITGLWKWSVVVDGSAVGVKKTGTWKETETVLVSNPEDQNESAEAAPVAVDPKVVFTGASSVGRWSKILAMLSSLKVGQRVVICADIKNLSQFKAQLRSMLHARKIGLEFFWRMENGNSDGELEVTKERRWTDQEKVIVQLLKLGKTLPTISQELGVGQAAIAAIQSIVVQDEEQVRRSEPVEMPAPESRGPYTGPLVPEVTVAMPPVEREASVAIEKTTTHSEKLTTAVRVNGEGDFGFPGERGPASVPAPYFTAQNSTQLKFKSGGLLDLRFIGDLFKLSEADRRFVFGIIDRMRFYETYGSPDKAGTEKPGLPLSGKGERLIWIQVPQSFVEDTMEQMSVEDRAAAVAAWFRDEPAVVPPQG